MTNILLISRAASDTINIIAFVLGVIGFVIAVINVFILVRTFCLRSRCGNLRRKRFEKKLAKEIGGINPDYIFAPDRNGINIAVSIAKRINFHGVIIPVLLYERKYAPKNRKGMTKTSKYYVKVPKTNISDALKIVIIDDVVITGETIEAIKRVLKNGIRPVKYSRQLLLPIPLHTN